MDQRFYSRSSSCASVGERRDLAIRGVFSRVYTLLVSCTTPGCFFVILGYVPGYQTWLLWSYSGMYPGSKPGYLFCTRVDTRVPNLVIFLMLGHTPGYRTWLFWLHLRRYPDTYPGYFGYICIYPNTKSAHFGHTRVCTRVTPEYTPTTHTLAAAGVVIGKRSAAVCSGVCTRYLIAK